MKFKFSKNLDYQIDAINAIVDLFDTGKNTHVDNTVFELHAGTSVVANELELESHRILTNLHCIQNEHSIEQANELGSLDFSVEMETGTGKTYVYLRTALQLHRKYGLKKFIVLVPSVAIREGVLKTIEQTKEHFREMFGVGFGSCAYDSSKLSQVREFIQSVDVQIMVMTVASFNKDTNILRQKDLDRFHGEVPLELLAETRPVIIMDEPQNMASDLAKASIADLNPLFKLRYSATHKEKHNLVYRLTPVDAYKKRLVKKIEVYGVRDDNAESFTFRIKNIIAKKGSSPTAKVMLEVQQKNGDYISKEMLIKAGTELERRTKNAKYTGLMVNEINATKNTIELSDGKVYEMDSAIDENKEAIFRTQIRETIKAHVEKQNKLQYKVKVLSLFFIDRVDNYVHDESIIRTIFEEEYEKQKKRSELLKQMDVKNVHNGYFAHVKKKGLVEYKDSKDGRETKADKEVFDLIMKDKERLLSFDEPLSFIFSHSALKEGWDNPNVFQICTLNETRSTMKKRQEIGRGLRLPVDREGNRVYDDRINVLTVVANESYQEFVGTLQKEYTEAGYTEPPQTGNAKRKVHITFKKHLPQESEDFNRLWEQIRKKTKYNIAVETKKLVELALEEINILDVDNLVIKIDKVIVDFGDDNKIKTIYETEAVGERLHTDIKIGNVIERIARETGLTKDTVFTILSSAENGDLLYENPEEYIRSVITIINNTKQTLLMNEGLRYIPSGDMWELDLFEDFKSYQTKTIESEKSVYTRVVWDSHGEREFAENLENSPRVTLFTKLPPRFIVDTPLGEYTPDWAIVMKTDDGEKVYLVRETKFVANLKNLRPSEQQKIKCGEKHFKAIGMDFRVTIKKDLSDLVLT